MSGESPWARSYYRALAQGYDHGYAAHVADQAQARAERPANREVLARNGKPGRPPKAYPDDAFLSAPIDERGYVDLRAARKKAGDA